MDERHLIARLRDAGTPRGVPVAFERVAARAQRRQRRRTALSVGALVVALAGGVPAGMSLVTSRPSVSSAAAPMDCPNEWSPRNPTNLATLVPQLPVGFDGAARLVPTDTPASAVLCRYPRPWLGTAPPEGEGAVRLGGDLSALAAELAWTPRQGGGRGCHYVGSPQTVYLLGLEYGGRRVWVNAVDDRSGCHIPTNGAFPARPSLGGRFAAAYRTGAWTLPVSATANPCAERATGWYQGRLGDDAGFVPEGATTVTVCPRGAGPAVPLTGAARATVLAALDSLNTQPQNGYSCVPGTKNGATPWFLRVGYPAGPGVQILVLPGCTPHVLGTGVQALDPRNRVQRAVEAALQHG